MANIFAFLHDLSEDMASLLDICLKLKLLLKGNRNRGKTGRMKYRNKVEAHDNNSKLGPPG